MIRKAKVSDIKAIHSLLLNYSETGVLLGRSLSDLYDQIRDFYVSVDDENNILEGICGLHVCWDDLGEIRSLAVKDEYKGQSMGLDLVNACIREAKDFGLNKLFVLTYVPDFFKKLGFENVDKKVLPHKVWADCMNCVKFPDCDEEAMMIKL
jgi:amino-acid N-acetyltransferase